VRTLLATLALLGAAVLSASAPALAQEQEPPPDSVIQAALDAASAQLGVPYQLIVVMTAQRDWPDASLGCPEPGHAYAQIITPGYVVTLDTDDLLTEVQVNTDTGSHAAIC
jgi:hypothetical protein